MGKEIEENKTVVTTTMSKAYQITVPSVVRKALGLEPGDPVDFEIDQGRAILVRAETREEKIKRVFADLDRIRERELSYMTVEQKNVLRCLRGGPLTSITSILISCLKLRLI